MKGRGRQDNVKGSFIVRRTQPTTADSEDGRRAMSRCLLGAGKNKEPDLPSEPPGRITLLPKP